MLTGPPSALPHEREGDLQPGRPAHLISHIAHPVPTGSTLPLRCLRGLRVPHPAASSSSLVSLYFTSAPGMLSPLRGWMFVSALFSQGSRPGLHSPHPSGVTNGELLLLFFHPHPICAHPFFCDHLWPRWAPCSAPPDLQLHSTLFTPFSVLFLDPSLTDTSCASLPAPPVYSTRSHSFFSWRGLLRRQRLPIPCTRRRFPCGIGP